MENIVWAALLWFLVILFIPYENIKNLSIVGVISLIWLFIMELIFTQLTYYQFNNYRFGILGIPVFYLIGGTAGGMFMIYWIKHGILNKISVVILFSFLLLLAEFIYVIRGAFAHLNGWNFYYSFLLNVFGLSLLVALCLIIAGKERIYKNNFCNHPRIK